MSIEVLKLGYDAAVAGLARQDANPGNLRNRAVAVLSAATIATTVGSGLGLLDAGSGSGTAVPRWIAIGVVMVTTLIGALTLAVPWPVQGWHHVVNPAVFVHHKDTPEDAFRELAIWRLDAAYEENQVLLNRRTSLLRLSVLLLIAALVLTAVSVVITGR